MSGTRIGFNRKLVSYGGMWSFDPYRMHDYRLGALSILIDYERTRISNLHHAKEEGPLSSWLNPGSATADNDQHSQPTHTS